MRSGDHINGEAVQDLRRRVGYTQQDLAEALGVTNTTVSRWERGGPIPRVKQQLILRLFGVPR